MIPGLILLAIASLIGYTAKDALLPAKDVRVIPVVLKAGVETGATSAVQAPGWVEADPYPVSVSALADGIVTEVLALEGQMINVGDVVARMIDDDAKLALARAEATSLEKRASLKAATANWDNPIERTRAVANSEAMVAETKADLEKLHADVAVEVARLVSMKLEAERTAESFKTRASSEIETVRSQQSYEAQKAVVDATKARRPVFEAQLAQRNAELTAANENLRLRIDEAKALAEAQAQLALATAARDEAALRLSRMEVRSPASGIVMQRLAAPGDKLVMNMDDPHSAHVVRLYDPSKLQVRVDIPVADAAKIGVGQDARIVVAVAPDRTFDGKVTRIVNEADIQKNTLQVKVAISNPSADLKPEMLARVRIVTGGATTRSTGDQTVFAPLDLIQRNGGEATVWVVDPRRNVAVHKSIVLGETQQEGWIAVMSGLSPGDQLIAEEAENLTDGQRIRVVGEVSTPNLKRNGNDHGPH
ncbi:MAG: efflux RND transporter periplasmic adaptor subunit [Anaerolineae bacterium]|nr:efflux RND transporter periplasmic adaptor subunit [Phycisphaerae bacterium]